MTQGGKRHIVMSLKLALTPWAHELQKYKFSFRPDLVSTQEDTFAMQGKMFTRLL